MALIVGGGAIGYRIAADRVRPSVEAAPVVVEEVAFDDADLEEPAAEMPDVVGLDRDAALEALADVGIDPAAVVFDERPYVGTEGRVVVQSPVRGSSDVADAQLTLSTAATVPDVVGASADEASGDLEALGAIVVRRDVYDPAVSDGTVVTVDPEPGGLLPAEVVVEVAAPPSSVFLSSIDTVDGSCSTGTASVNGTTSDAAVSCSEGFDDGATASYDLGRHVDRFRATAGVDDDDTFGGQVRLRIVADGNQLFDQVLVFGTATPIDVVTTGALRLEIFVSDTNPDDDEYDVPSAVLLDAAFLGAPDAIALVGGGS